MDPEAYLSHRDFVHDLARQLVADEADADDVEQQAWLAALERDDNSIRSPRKWLAASVRNLARRRFRDSVRRGRRERAAATDDAIPSLESVRDHEDARRSVVEAVFELDEPFRTCVIMRYFSNLPPREIARRLDVPLDTVKSRLKRGLSRLRARLDRDHGGDRNAWCAAILPLANSPAVITGTSASTTGLAKLGSSAFSGATTGLLSGVLIMKSAFIAGSALTFLVATWILLSRPGSTEGDPETLATTSMNAPSQPDGITDTTSQVALRTPVDTPPTETTETPTKPEEATAPAGTLPLTGIVLLPDGRPAPDTTVSIIRDEKDMFRSYLAGSEPRRRTLFEEVTAQDGRFSFSLLPAVPVRLIAEKNGFPRREILQTFAGTQVTVQLEHGSTIYGRITRADDGRPITKCGLRAFRVGEGVTLFEGQTDATGQYRFEGVESGDFVIDLTPVGATSPGWTEVHLEKGTTLQRDFALLPGATLSGRVTDSTTGAPIPGAVVGEDWTMDRQVSCGPDGRYTFAGFGSPGTSEVVFEAAGYGRVRMDSPILESTETEFTLDVSLAPARSAVGRVLDLTGQPVAEALVTAYSSGSASERIVGSSDAEGRFELQGLSPVAHHALYIRHQDTAIMVFDFPADEFQRDPVDLGDLSIPGPTAVTGRVVNEFGRPISEAEVNLQVTYAERGTLSQQETPWFLDYQGTRRQVVTDPEGRFRVEQLAPGSCLIRAFGPGATMSGERSVEISAGSTPPAIELVISMGHSIQGSVHTPDGKPTSMASVRAYDEAGDLRGSHGNLPEDGAFHIAGLKPGTYRLEVIPHRWVNDDESNPYYMPTDREGVLANTTGVKMTLARGDAIAGRVVGKGGEALGHARVYAMDQDGQVVAETQAGARGLFEVVVHPDTIYTLRATTDDDDPVYVAEEDARAGTRNVVLRPRS